MTFLVMHYLPGADDPAVVECSTLDAAEEIATALLVANEHDNVTIEVEP